MASKKPKISCCEKAKVVLTCGIVADILRMDGDDTNAVAIARNWGILGHKLAYLKELGVQEYDLEELRRIF